MKNIWQPIGKITPQALAEGKLQLHYAIQFIAAPGFALAAPQPDYSQMALEWQPKLEAFAGKAISAEKPFRVTLDPIGLAVMIVDASDTQDLKIAPFYLDGKTMAEGLTWLKVEIAKLGAAAQKVVWLDYPPDDFPDRPIDATFDTSQVEVLQELANYYANSHPLLEEIAATHTGASAVNIWPHHFDMATLISLSGMKNGESMSIGAGFSPGDKSYNEPYWYVTPWPYPDTESLPILGGNGFWHTQHWVGAVLTASQLPKDADGQKQQVLAFLESAISESRSLLGAS